MPVDLASLMDSLCADAECLAPLSCNTLARLINKWFTAIIRVCKSLGFGTQRKNPYGRMNRRRTRLKESLFLVGFGRIIDLGVVQ